MLHGFAALQGPQNLEPSRGDLITVFDAVENLYIRGSRDAGRYWSEPDAQRLSVVHE